MPTLTIGGSETDTAIMLAGIVVGAGAGSVVVVTTTASVVAGAAAVVDGSSAIVVGTMVIVVTVGEGAGTGVLAKDVLAQPDSTSAAPTIKKGMPKPRL